MNQLMSDGVDCRTAPATPGLLITHFWGKNIQRKITAEDGGGNGGKLGFG